MSFLKDQTIYRYTGEDMTLTYNIPINLSDEDRLFWEQLLNESAKAYDECAERIRSKGIRLDIKSVHGEVYAWLREKHPIIPSQGIIKTYKDVISALRSMKSNKHKGGNTPVKHGLSMRLDKRLYANLDRSGISISGSHRGKRARVTFSLFPKVEEMFSKYTTADPLIFLRDGVFYLSVPFNVPETPVDGNTCIGVDMGMKRFFVTSEGNAFKDKAYADRRRKVRYNKSKLKVRNTKSAKRKLKKLKHKEQNMSKDMCYRAANVLIRSTKASVIVMEDLSKIKQTTSKTKEGYKRKRHNNAISQVPFYKFREILDYKALLSGKEVVTVSPIDTSRINSRTGKKDGIREGCRYRCLDGVMLDADWNASINIGRRSKHPTSSSLPLDGKLNPLSAGTCQRANRGDESLCKPLNL